VPDPPSPSLTIQPATRLATDRSRPYVRRSRHRHLRPPQRRRRGPGPGHAALDAQHRRWLLAGLATTAGFAAWNLTLDATHARGFNTDAPLIALSWADAGSGVLAFALAAAALALVARREPAGRVVGAAATAGLVAAIVDIFVL